MLQLKINNPQIETIFETKFHSNQEKFIEFIVDFIENNKKIVDKYFDKKSKSKIKYKRLNPMENYYTISIDENQVEMTNPFENIDNSVDFAKKLREESYR